MRACRGSRKESRERGRITKRKMHRPTQVELWISSVFCVLFVSWGTKNDENGVPGPVRDRVGIQTPTKTKKIKSGKRFRRAFWGHFGTFGEAFFYCFCWDVPFSLLGAIWVPKGAERVPKGS